METALEARVSSGFQIRCNLKPIKTEPAGFVDLAVNRA